MSWFSMGKKTGIVKFLIGIVVFCVLPLLDLHGQQKYCGEGRYVYNLYEVNDSITVKYGENITKGGKTQELFMDVFKPAKDPASKRPAIIFLFGGSFVDGDRSQVYPLCKYYAKKGYVTAAIDYRLFDGQGIPDSAGIIDVAIKAMGDLKAAIRHLRRDAATSNQFKIDPDFILVGGISSGSIACLHAAYMDDDDDIPEFIRTIIEENGGFEGSSGDDDNLKYSSKINGVMNYFGGIYDKNWIDKNEPPVSSIHGEKDDVVSYGDGKASVKVGSTVLTSVSISGSGSIHKMANQIGIENVLISVPNGGHGEFLEESLWVDSMLNNTTQLFHNKLICPDYVGINTLSDNTGPIIYPNPSSGNIIIDLQNQKVETVEIIDLIGKVIFEKTNTAENSKLKISNLLPGVYLVRVTSSQMNSHLFVKKIIVR